MYTLPVAARSRFWCSACICGSVYAVGVKRSLACIAWESIILAKIGQQKTGWFPLSDSPTHNPNCCQCLMSLTKVAGSGSGAGGCGV